MTLQRALAHDDITAALGYDPQGNLAVTDLVVNATDSLAAGWAATSGGVGATAGSIGTSSAAIRTKKVGKTVHLQAHVTITTAGTGSGAVTVLLPFTPAVNCVLTGYDSLTNKAVTASLIANSTQANLHFYDGSYPGTTGANLYFHGAYESIS